MGFRHLVLARTQGIVVSSARQSEDRVVMRIHSSCAFGEALLSLDCDCGTQLVSALNIINKEGGHLIYLFDEGRGAGLKAKFDALILQQKHTIDTVSAFAHLGLQPDLRNYNEIVPLAADLARGLPIDLLTNNPDKLAPLIDSGLVVRRRPLLTATAESTKAYLEEKAKVLGHLIAPP